jgi:hypothetical protein
MELQERAEHEVQPEGEMPIAERWNWLTWLFAISSSLKHAIPESRFKPVLKMSVRFLAADFLAPGA